MNTGFVRTAVATVLTVYGIETVIPVGYRDINTELQQYLPFTVLKLNLLPMINRLRRVATVLTVYGIETWFIHP